MCIHLLNFDKMRDNTTTRLRSYWNGRGIVLVSPDRHSFVLTHIYI